MTELIWDGKYDAQGRRVAPPRIALPFQTVETVNESAADRTRNLDFFADGKTAEWRNRLVWGDKKYVLPSLLGEFAGRVNLVYIDPPFATGGDFSYTASVPDAPDGEDGGPAGVTFVKEPSVIEQKAYRDTWGRGLDGYLKWFYETVVLLRELLAEDGSIYVHLDHNVGHYAKAVLDEVFGEARYQNEIVWQRTDPHNDARKRFGNVHDAIFWYSKSETSRYYADQVRTALSYAATAEYSLLELSSGEIVPYAGNEDREGRRFKLENATWKGSNPKKKFVWRGASPSDKREWIYDFDGMEKALATGELYLRNPEKGSARCKKLYFDTNQGTLLQSIWTDVGRMKGGSRYATEKPELLLERIVKASSASGDLVLDCFCGSGTTAAVAEKLGRRWITCDLGRFAIHTTRKRLLGIPDVRPFVVQNLGKYERQAWQAAEFGATAEAQTNAYRHFILELYRGQPVSGYAWLHGVKTGRMVHVGSVDAPVTMADVTAVVAELRRAAGTGTKAPTRTAVDLLGWDFAFELNETAKQQAALAGVDVRLVRIPREVLEKKAVEQGDIRFFELAALAVSTKTKGRQVTLELTDFIIPLDDVPDDVRRAVTHWEQWIDYWAVDWNNAGDAFHNEWQAYRTRKAKSLEKRTVHTYDEPGAYRVVVKVIDILGNDTTRVVDVEVL